MVIVGPAVVQAIHAAIAFGAGSSDNIRHSRWELFRLYRTPLRFASLIPALDLERRQVAGDDGVFENLPGTGDEVAEA